MGGGREMEKYPSSEALMVRERKGGRGEGGRREGNGEVSQRRVPDRISIVRFSTHLHTHARKHTHTPEGEKGRQGIVWKSRE